MVSLRITLGFLFVQPSRDGNFNLFKLFLHNSSSGNAVYYTPSTMGHGVMLSSVNDVARSVIIRNLIDFIFNVLPVFIRRWEIQIYFRRDFFP
jgi:hypothetical protein